MKYLFILLLTVTAFAFDYPITLQEVALYSGDLAGYWKLQGNALDYSGNGNNGTVVGAVSTGSNYWFDGVNDYIDADGSDYEFKKTDAFSVSVWANTSETDCRLFNNRVNDGSNNHTGWFIGIASGKAFGWIGFYNGGYKWLQANSEKIVNDNQWHLLTFVNTGVAGEQTIYVDGIDVTDNRVNETSVMTYSVAHPVFIGKDNSSSVFFNGYIKDVRIYDRALTAEEIGNIYNETLPKHTINLFDSKPTTVTDLSDEGNDGTVYGATMTDDGMSFDGVDDYIDCGSSADFNLANAITLCIWTKTDKSSLHIFNKYYKKANKRQYLLGSDGGKTRCIISTDGTVNFNKYCSLEGISIVTNDVWTHIAATFDGATTTMRIYVNGNLEATNTNVPFSTIFTSDAKLMFGNREGIDGGWFNGSIDNAVIYSRAITPSEITALYNAGRNASKDVISTNGLVLFYDFDVPERTLTLQEPTYYYGDLDGWWKLQGNALDYSKNDNDGTVYGAVSTGTNYYFDGVNDYITADSTIEYPFTLSAWVKMTANDDGIILSVADSSDTEYFAIMHRTSAFHARTYDGASVKESTIANATFEEWHYVVGVFRSSTSRQIYVDAAAGAENTTAANAVPVNIAKIGVTADSTPVNYLKGYIKDVRIYDRALTAEDINKIYNATK